VDVPKLAGEVPTFDIWVTYADVAKKEWVTVARYVSPRKRYEEISIDPLLEGAYGLRNRNPIQPVPASSWRGRLISNLRWLARK
jgi:hypothetical protein